MVSALALAGTGVGIGIVLFLGALVGRRPSLETELARLDPFGASFGALAPGEGAGLLTGVGERVLGVLTRLSGGSGRLEADLAVSGVGRTKHASTVATALLAGTAAPPALSAAWALTGAKISLVVPLAMCLACGAAGALVPVVSLRRRAARSRRRFRHALGSWLELVAMAQAAGMGLESALQAASGICDDPSFELIRRAVESARNAGLPPWEGLGRLGRELDVGDLEELGASLALAGSEGARIRGSLSSKAASLRRRDLAEAEAEANSMTERLFLPSIVLMFGFILFIGYPAVVTVTHVL